MYVECNNKHWVGIHRTATHRHAITVHCVVIHSNERRNRRRGNTLLILETFGSARWTARPIRSFQKENHRNVHPSIVFETGNHPDRRQQYRWPVNGIVFPDGSQMDLIWMIIIFLRPFSEFNILGVSELSMNCRKKKWLKRLQRFDDQRSLNIRTFHEHIFAQIFQVSPSVFLGKNGESNEENGEPLETSDIEMNGD